MDRAQHGAIVNFIWGIADDVLRDVYVRGKYRDVILPMTVIRRLDSVLEPTKDAVLAMSKRLDEMGVVAKEQTLAPTAGQAFYNVSPFTLRGLMASPKQLRANFEAYLDGFSPNVQEVLDKFKFRNQIPTLVEADALGRLIEKFLETGINLGPKPVYDVHGNVRLPGLDNHAMGTIFEELIRKFNEENNEEAGEHFTPRDVVRLMANLIFLPIANRIESGTYLVYDGACGTGGMLTVAEETLSALAAAHGKDAAIHLFGQEVNPETFAITKADLLLKGEGEEAEQMRFGSTLAADGFPTHEFDFMLSNPPYGKSWKTDLERMGGKAGLSDPRFVVTHDGDPEFGLMTRSSDGQMMFLVNMLSKMKRETALGSRIAEVHNGSALFTGDAGSGESNIRRWIIENDWLEAIVALPLSMFYNTGIATYIWVLSNRKPAARRGKVQLIDATGWFRPLRRNLGQKNCELGEEHIGRICAAFLSMEESEQSKVFPNGAFGYWKVTVERPLRLQVDLSAAAIDRLAAAAKAAKDPEVVEIAREVARMHGDGPHLDYNGLRAAFEEAARMHGSRWTAKREKVVREGLCTRNEDADAVVVRSTRADGGSDAAGGRLHGRIPTEIGGHVFLNEYEPDPDQRDTEQAPLLEPGGIAGFIEREVWPHAPDVWVAGSKSQVGYEISFTRYFYTPTPLRTLAEIRADIEALEAETAGLLGQIMVEAGGSR